jgi:hypothetical protein
MQNIQLKLENIRSAFQNQQAGCKSLKEVPEGAFQNLVPASENVMRSRMIFFSPKHGKAACFYICYVFFVLLVFPLMNMIYLLHSF